MKRDIGKYILLQGSDGIRLLETCDFDAGMFIICENGTLNFLLDAQLYMLSKNGILSLTPSSIFHVKSISTDFVGHAIVYPSYIADEGLMKENLLAFLLYVKDKPILTLSEDRMRIAIEYVNLINSLLSQDIIHPHPMVDGIIQSLIFTVYTGYTYLAKSIEQNTSFSLDRSRHILMEFLKLVRKFYLKEREVRFYADKLFVSPKYLCNAVKQACNLTPSQIINQAIILAAKSRLRNSSCSVSQIAYDLNFDNPSFFGKFFKRHVGCTPGYYQKHYGVTSLRNVKEECQEPDKKD